LTLSDGRVVLEKNLANIAIPGFITNFSKEDRVELNRRN
jgi:hypothetical protein